MPTSGNGRRRDLGAWCTGAAALILSVVAFVVTYWQGNVLVHTDAISHMEIARRTVDGITPGLAQLGSVWPPLTHILMMPLVWNNTLYHTGIAGAIYSMVAFVAAVVLVYKIVRQLTGRTVAGIAGAVVFACNLNILYMQSTPMTELPLYATLLGLLYGLIRWIDTDRYAYLVGAALSAVAATLVRYESWVILACLLPVVIYATLRQRQSWDPAWSTADMATFKVRRKLKTQDVAIVFVSLGFLGIIGWFLWNWIIFGNALEFQSGNYAKPALWLTNNEPSIGHWGLAAKAFYYAVTDLIPWPLLILAGVGLVVFAVSEFRRGKQAGRGWIVLGTLVMAPFFIVSIYTGQRPLHVAQVNGNLYNVRFGLIMLIPVSILIGYLVGKMGRSRVALTLAAEIVMILALVTGGLMLKDSNVVTLNEPRALLPGIMAVQGPAADEFHQVYDDGDVLMETFGNERLNFLAIPSAHLVYEGTNKDNRWNRALVNPADANIRWVVMRCEQGYVDRVCTALQGSPALTGGYRLVWGNDNYKIYKKA